MKMLTDSQLRAAIDGMEAACAAHLDGELGAFDRWLQNCGNRPARLEFPLGELLNEQIRGLAWVWSLKGAIRTEGITKRDRFNAQGIEGKSIVEGVSLVTALLVARDLPKHRVAVYTDGAGKA